MIAGAVVLCLVAVAVYAYYQVLHRKKKKENEREFIRIHEENQEQTNQLARMDNQNNLLEKPRLNQEDIGNQRLNQKTADRLEREAADRLEREADRLEQEADRLKQEAANRVKQEAADMLKQEAADMLKQEAADRLKQEAEDKLKQEEIERNSQEIARLEHEVHIEENQILENQCFGDTLGSYARASSSQQKSFGHGACLSFEDYKGAVALINKLQSLNIQERCKILDLEDEQCLEVNEDWLDIIPFMGFVKEFFKVEQEAQTDARLRTVVKGTCDSDNFVVVSSQPTDNEDQGLCQLFFAWGDLHSYRIPQTSPVTFDCSGATGGVNIKFGDSQHKARMQIKITDDFQPQLFFESNAFSNKFDQRVTNIQVDTKKRQISFST
jgi:hypothetical protein